MRWIVPLGALAALAFAQTAAAAPVAVGDVHLSPEFQSVLEEKLGPREGAMLQQVVSRELSRALVRHGADVGAGGLTVDATIVDAYPNQPTMQQLSHTPGLSLIGSVSIGGAELQATIRNSDGSVVDEVKHRRYSNSLDEVISPGEWSDARRAIRQFADKVATAVAAR